MHEFSKAYPVHIHTQVVECVRWIFETYPSNLFLLQLGFKKLFYPSWSCWISTSYNTTDDASNKLPVHFRSNLFFFIPFSIHSAVASEYSSSSSARGWELRLDISIQKMHNKTCALLLWLQRRRRRPTKEDEDVGSFLSVNLLLIPALEGRPTCWWELVELDLHRRCTYSNMLLFPPTRLVFDWYGNDLSYFWSQVSLRYVLEDEK